MMTKILTIISILYSFVSYAEFAQSNAAKKRAYFYYNRITGTAPNINDPVFLDVVNNIESGNYKQAALLVTQNKNLINIKLKNYFKDWTNRDGTKNVNVNDMVMLMLGFIRDDRDFREVLSTDDMYSVSFDGMKYTFPPNGEIADRPGHPGGAMFPYIDNYKRDDGGNVTYDSDGNKEFEFIFWKKNYQVYNNGNNFDFKAFENVENAFVDLNRYLEAAPRTLRWEDFDQNGSGNIPYRDASQTFVGRGLAAGVMTSNVFSQHFYLAGTNRRATQYVFRNFLCKEFEEVADTTVDTQYIRRDVDRFPNGSTSKYLNFCVGCHAGQDSLGRAFYHYVERGAGELIMHNNPYNPFRSYGHKMNVISNYPDGYVAGLNPDGSAQEYPSRWKNLWVNGKNSKLGFNSKWRSSTLGGDSSAPPHEGVGAKELGSYLGDSLAFRECMAERMYEMVCVNRNDENFNAHKTELAQSFANNGHNMRDLIADVATRCPYED